MLNEEEKIQFLTGKLSPVLKPSLNVVRIFLSTASQHGLIVYLFLLTKIQSSLFLF